MKLTYEDKIEIFEARKEGRTLSSLAKKYNIDLSNIKYLIRLIERHGYSIIKDESKLYYTKEFEMSCIDRVLIKGESSMSVSIDEGFRSKGMLRNWIREYKENGYNIVEKKRGRIPMTKAKKEKENTINDLEKLKEENEYLRAEVAFLKKWNAVVQLEEKRKKKK